MTQLAAFHCVSVSVKTNKYRADKSNRQQRDSYERKHRVC